MPGYKNRFKAPEFVEVAIVGGNGGRVGTIRLKPSSVLWKAKGQHSFLAVPLEKFVQWITDPETLARKAAK
jgi:hypothetical protein